MHQTARSASISTRFSSVGRRDKRTAASDRANCGVFVRMSPPGGGRSTRAQDVRTVS